MAAHRRAGAKAPSSRFKERFLLAGTAVVLVMVVGSAGVGVVGYLRCADFKQEFVAAAERHIGAGRADVASVVSAREATRQLVEARGGPRRRLMARLERRDLPGGGVVHVIVLEGKAGGCLAEYELDLGAQLAPVAIEAFARADIREYHHHRR